MRTGLPPTNSTPVATVGRQVRIAEDGSWKFLVSRGDRVPMYIPNADEFAQKFAKLTGGFPMSMLLEILSDIPGTVHCIGGLRDRRFFH